MTNVLWEITEVPGEVSAPLPDAARKVVEGVQAGTAGALFPPVVRDSAAGVLSVERLLTGDADARMLAQALAAPRFAPLLDMFGDLDAWCRAATRRHRAVIEPGVLEVTNAGLFKPLVSEAFVACAAGRAAYARRFVPAQRLRFEQALDLFLVRLRRDLRSSWPDAPALRPPVAGLQAHDGETHNGRRRVLRVRMAGGGHVAYKPRPAGGEMLFLAEGAPGRSGPTSLFGLLNGLPAASGEVVLPVMRCWTGRDRETYLWQEWIEPPHQWGTIRDTDGLRLEGTRLDPAQAERFWCRAGALTAASFGLGIADLIEGNLLSGTRPGDPEPLFYPVDLEVYFARLPRLRNTGLVGGDQDGESHHVGLENLARPCAADGPVACFFTTPDGGLQLRRRSRAWARAETRSVVADTEGRTGYGAYLPAFLRGMFDTWTLMCRHRSRLRDHAEHSSRGCFVRVLLKSTETYGDALDHRLLSGGGAALHASSGDVRFSRRELEQMRRMDVPYFFRRAEGGPLLTLDPRSNSAPVRVRPARGDAWQPSPAAPPSENLTLLGLGVAIRDAVEYVYDDLGEHTLLDEARGVRVHLDGARNGTASFDWHQAGRRVTYNWNDTKVSIRLDALPEGLGATSRREHAADIGRRLLRIDRVDAALRESWVESGFRDVALEERLERLNAGAMAWLRDVVRDHGWPGAALLDEPAAEAAARLLQHTEGHLAFRKRCLQLMREAATAGDVPWRQVAYVTDSLRIEEGRPQLYGTKFRDEDGRLAPFPIEHREKVDERRKRMGLEPLDRYARRLRDRFALTVADDS